MASSAPIPETARWHLDLIVLNLVLILVWCGISARAYGVYRNTLAEHPEWVSTKPRLSKEVMGAATFVSGRRPLLRNRLDLGAWFGFQEVVHHQELNLARLDARVRFEPDGYINVLYDVRGDGFSGIRLSNRRDLPSIQFRATPDGEFLSTTQLALPDALAPNATHAVRLGFEFNRATVSLGGRPVGSFERSDGRQRIGFRGGQRAAWVDDVALQLADGGSVRETFTNTRRPAPRTFVLFCLGILVIGLGGLAVSRRLGVPARTAGLWAVIVNLGALTAAAGGYAFQFFSPARYPTARRDQAQAQAAQRMSEERKQIVARLQREYAEPARDRYRILFLGSSQTWGAGAAAPEDVWVRQLERMLNRDGRAQPVECVNAGLSGLTGSGTLEILRGLLPLRPQAALINLSNNDTDTAAFRSNLDSLVTTLTQAGIRPILVLEPNSPERRITDSDHGDLAVKHAIVTGVGRVYGIPVVDMHHYLEVKNRTGFLWWDFVHLTSYGQRLMAAKLHVELPPLLSLR